MSKQFLKYCAMLPQYQSEEKVCEGSEYCMLTPLMISAMIKIAFK